MGRERWFRRIAGLLKTRLQDPGLHRVADPRRGKRRWAMGTVLGALLVGMVAGRRSLAEVEDLTTDMSKGMRGLLGLRRRLPDTTARDLLVALDPHELRGALHRQVRRAHRRKALEPEMFPWGVLSLDGKVTAIRAWDDRFVQRNKDKGLMRTVTATLVSSAARVAVDAIPIPPHTNEMGFYAEALAQLVDTYASLDLFRVVMYDAGACSEANARKTRELGLHYVMVLNDAQPTLHAEARRVLREQAGEAVFDTIEPGIRYRIQRTELMAGYLDWTHLRTVVRVQREVLDASGRVVSRGERFFVTSLRARALSPRKWVELTRARWGVENNCHHTFDVAFAEDDSPWITGDAIGALNVLLLRRIAYNMLALFRSRTLSGELTRLVPWKDLLRKVERTLIAAAETTVAAIRPRAPPPLALRP